LPELFEALEVIRPEGTSLVLEVQRQLPDNWVRCIAMDTTDGLMRACRCGGRMHRSRFRSGRRRWDVFLMCWDNP